jgi:hypothetical protein
VIRSFSLEVSAICDASGFGPEEECVVEQKLLVSNAERDLIRNRFGVRESDGVEERRVEACIRGLQVWLLAGRRSVVGR